MKKFFAYLYGHHYILITDHKPLTSIFHPAKSLRAISAARLQRYAIFCPVLPMMLSPGRPAITAMPTLCRVCLCNVMSKRQNLMLSVTPSTRSTSLSCQLSLLELLIFDALLLVTQSCHVYTFHSVWMA